MDQPQIIRTASGEELVVIARKDYDALIAAFEDALEDEADVAMLDSRLAEMKGDKDSLLPQGVTMLIIKGHGLLKALRTWRNLSQEELAAKAGIAQGYLSDMENKRKTGSPETLAKLAAALDVPQKWLPGA